MGVFHISDYIILNGELYHHGILGQKWGVRRYQNKDGSLTAAGRKRYINKDGSLTEVGRKRFLKKNGSLNNQGRLAAEDEMAEFLSRYSYDNEPYEKVINEAQCSELIQSVMKEPKIQSANKEVREARRIHDEHDIYGKFEKDTKFKKEYLEAHKDSDFYESPFDEWLNKYPKFKKMWEEDYTRMLNADKKRGAIYANYFLFTPYDLTHGYHSSGLFVLEELLEREANKKKL